MSAGKRGRRRGGHGAEHGTDERWLLTYADMITLLMALFMVLFSISSVNTSKFESLQRALQDAFSGRILPGGESFQQGAGADQTSEVSPEPPLPALRPNFAADGEEHDSEREREQDRLEEARRRIEEEARRLGLEKEIEAEVMRRGLVVRLLTDRILFSSGKADLKPQARPILSDIARILRPELSHPLMVEGHTDNVPIREPRYPTNWELSGARAASVVRFLIQRGVPPGQLGATGFAHLRPVTSNRSAEGRAHNRRVEIVLLRTGSGEGERPLTAAEGAAGAPGEEHGDEGH